MMTKTFQVFMLLAVLLYFVLLVQMLKRKNLNLKYTLVWLFSGILMLVLSAFPQLLNEFAGLLGVYDPTNALFALVFFCGIIILMSLTAIVSHLNEKNKRLIQSVALLEKRVRELEEGDRIEC